MDWVVCFFNIELPELKNSLFLTDNCFLLALLWDRCCLGCVYVSFLIFWIHVCLVITIVPNTQIRLDLSKLADNSAHRYL